MQTSFVLQFSFFLHYHHQYLAKMVSVLSPDQMQKWNLIANFVRYSYCFEYDLAIENGLRLANKHSDLRSKDDQEQISQQKAEILLRCVETATRKVKNSIPASTIDEKACDLLNTATSEDESRYNKAYKYFPEITMKSTLLNSAYHSIANLIIIEAFSSYQTAIEQGKMEAMNKIGRKDKVTVRLVLQEVHKSIGKSCMTVRIDFDALMERDEFRACISQSCDCVSIRNGLQDFENIENVSDQTASISTNLEQQSKVDSRDSLDSTSSEQLPGSSMSSIPLLFNSNRASEDTPATEGSSSTSQEAASIIDLSSDEEEDNVTHNAGIHKRLRKARYSGFYQEYSDSDEEDEDHVKSRRRFQRLQTSTDTRSK
jgi:hypothetical protein